MDQNYFERLKFVKTLKEASPGVIAKYRSIFPEFLINEWQCHGFASYMKGNLITTNPDDFEIILDAIGEDSRCCHVVLRTAFGHLVYYKNGEYFEITMINNIRVNEGATKLEWVFDEMFEGYSDEAIDKKLFPKALKKCGPLEYDEMYGFFPALGMGGDYDIEYVQKTKLKEHLVFLAQL